jgi:hypothetical protein
MKQNKASHASGRLKRMGLLQNLFTLTAILLCNVIPNKIPEILLYRKLVSIIRNQQRLAVIELLRHFTINNAAKPSSVALHPVLHHHP